MKSFLIFLFLTFSFSYEYDMLRGLDFPMRRSLISGQTFIWYSRGNSRWLESFEANVWCYKTQTTRDRYFWTTPPPHYMKLFVTSKWCCPDGDNETGGASRFPCTDPQQQPSEIQVLSTFTYKFWYVEDYINQNCKTDENLQNTFHMERKKIARALYP